MGGGIDRRQRAVGQPGSRIGSSSTANPGKRTLTEQLPPIQRSASASSPQTLDGSAAVQRKPDDEQTRQQPEGARVDRLIQVLAAPTPPAPGRDDAYVLLSSLGIAELLAVMEGVADCGYLPQLRARVTSWTNPLTAARLLSALYAIEFVRVPPDAVATGQLKAAGMALDLLPHDQQVQIVEYVLHHRGVASASASPRCSRARWRCARGPFYIGNAAHIGIAGMLLLIAMIFLAPVGA